MTETLKPFTIYFSFENKTRCTPSFILHGDEIYQFMGYVKDNKPIFGWRYEYGILSTFRWVAFP